MSSSSSAPKFDLESYINDYKGHTRLARLAFIAKQVSDETVSKKSFSLLLRNLKSDGINSAMYEDTVTLAQGKFGADDFSINVEWMASARAQADEMQEKLSGIVESFKLNSVKENSRVALNNLGAFFVKRGNLVQAQRVYVAVQDYCRTQKHNVERLQNLLVCALDLKQWNKASNYALKLQQCVRNGGDQNVSTAVNVAKGLVDLARGNYKSAAGWFLQTNVVLATGLHEMISSSDVALYGCLCALATYERKDIHKKLVKNSEFFQVGQDSKLGVHKMVTAFYSGEHSAGFSCIRELEFRCRADIYIARHWDKISSLIRCRTICQYFQPYTSVSLALMADALGTPIGKLESECAKLINEGQLKARIDSQNKILRASESDPRVLTFRKVVATGEKFSRSMHSTLLRLSLLQHDFVHKGTRVIHHVNQINDYDQQKDSLDGEQQQQQQVAQDGQ